MNQITIEIGSINPVNELLDTLNKNNLSSYLHAYNLFSKTLTVFKSRIDVNTKVYITKKIQEHIKEINKLLPIESNSIHEIDNLLSMVTLYLQHEYYKKVIFISPQDKIENIITPESILKIIDALAKKHDRENIVYEQIIAQALDDLNRHQWHQQNISGGNDSSSENDIHCANEKTKQINFINDLLINIEYKTDENIVCTGANGSGKTRLANDLLKTIKIVPDTSHNANKQDSDFNKTISKSLYVIPAEKAINLSPKSWNFPKVQYLQNCQTPNDKNHYQYDHLYELLNNAHWQSSLINNQDDNPNNILKGIIESWGDILNRKISIEISQDKIGQYDVYNTENDIYYPLNEASSGERNILFYLLFFSKEVLPKNSFILIDEPETYLETNTVIRLFDKLEKERQDCVFMYLTHNVDFATSRKNANHLWLKGYKGYLDFEMEILPKDDRIPKELLIKIYGNSRDVLFCEGKSTSIDYQIYSAVLNDYNIYPVDGCENVINHTKAINSLDHNYKAIGIIDADYRSNEEKDNLKECSIFSLPFAEIENLLISESILKEIISIRQLDVNQDDLFQEITNHITSQIKNNEAEILKSALEKIKVKIEAILTKYKLNSKSQKDLVDNLTTLSDTLRDNVKNLNNEVNEHENNIKNENDYNTLLKIYKNKGLSTYIKSFLNVGSYSTEILNKIPQKNNLKSLLKCLILENHKS